VVGTPEQVRERLSALAAEYAVDELVVVGITHDPKARLRSYELLASAFELERREEALS
jgi:alkanesulfonate monooxygenase SsuD/methylene tetrahydromethanopterin reductase-like flavin-dependent oxidoreductase (luciferase family)